MKYAYLKKDDGFILMEALIALSLISVGILIVLSTYSSQLVKRQQWYQTVEVSRTLYEESCHLVDKNYIRKTFFEPIAVNKSDSQVSVQSAELSLQVSILGSEWEFEDHAKTLKDMQNEREKKTETSSDTEKGATGNEQNQSSENEEKP